MKAISLTFLLLLSLAACTTGAQEPLWPLPDGEDRPTPLSFGLYVTPDPDQNPIDPPERFTGYHVGTDFEILPGEEDTDVPVFAICSGRVAFSGSAEGYGGLLVQRCTAKGKPVTVLYGHLAISSLPVESTLLKERQQLGILASGRSIDSGYNRKHLHLGIHRGKNLNLLGYVQKEEDFSEYIDPMTVLGK